MTSSNGGRSTESATSADLTRAAFLERSSLALQSPAQRADPSLQATPTADVAQDSSDAFSPALPPTPFVVGSPLSQTAVHYYNLDGYTPDGSWPCQSCLRYTNGGFEVNTTFVSTTPSFSITARDPAHYCYECYDTSPPVATQLDVSHCQASYQEALSTAQASEDSARATRTPPNDDLTPETFASADWRKALDDDNGVVANLDDIFKTCSTLLSTQVYPTTGKAPIHVSKPKQSRWDQLLKAHGKLDLQKWTVKRSNLFYFYITHI